MSIVCFGRLPNRELAGHVRVSEIWVPVRRDPPKIIAHHPILVERASCPERPRDCNYRGKADHASEADQHDRSAVLITMYLDPKHSASQHRDDLKGVAVNRGRWDSTPVSPN